MVLYLVPAIALTLIACAIVVEFATRSQSRRPLSRHALNKRRWDDPNNTDKRTTAVPGSLVASGMTLGHQGTYWISKDPSVQAEFLSGQD